LQEQDCIDSLRDLIAAGEHWYVAILKTMSRWSLAEETIGDRSYRYLIGGEAFDWLVLAERLLDEVEGAVSVEDREDLLFNGHPPLEIDDDEFQLLIGTPKYQAYLNFLYGVTVEEALHYAVEEEVAKSTTATSGRRRTVKKQAFIAGFTAIRRTTFSRSSTKNGSRRRAGL
jgi:hypothetical protein